MKMYVDELPEDCLDCPCDSEYYCNLLNEDIGCCKWGEIHKNCPLQSLADYTKQVRKEVCEEIRDFVEKPENSIYWDCSIYVETEDLRKLLDQIQGETK